MVDSVSNSTITAAANSVAEEVEVEATPVQKASTGLLELSILKAELTGEPLPEFTQSFVSVVYGN